MKIILVLLLSQLYNTPARSADQSYITYGENTYINSFDPYTIHETAAHRLSDLVFDSLVSVKTTGGYAPKLAKSWEISKGSDSVTLRLRKGVSWHNHTKGQPDHLFGAKDVQTTIRLIQSPKSQIPNKERFNIIKSVDTLSQSKIRINFNRALKDPLRIITFKILPHHLLKDQNSLKKNSKFALAPSGTGPYMIKEINNQGELLLESNKKYFLGKPKIKKIVMKSFADKTIMAQSLMYQSLDLVTNVSPRDLPEITGDKNLGVVPYDALSFSFIAFNLNRSKLKDKRVRQALNYAINRKEMLGAFFENKGTLITGPIPPTSWAYNLEVTGYPFEPERSRKLLQQAGFKLINGVLHDSKGKKFSLKFLVPLTGESETLKRIALAYQNYLTQIGIEVNLEFLDWSIWKKNVLQKHNFDITIASWSFDDATNITSLFHSSSAVPWGNNFVSFKNQSVDSMLNEAHSTNDFEKRRAIYRKLHHIISDEAPYTFLWTLMHHAAHNHRLKSIKVEPFSFFRHILSWKVDERERRTNGR